MIGQFISTYEENGMFHGGQFVQGTVDMRCNGFTQFFRLMDDAGYQRDKMSGICLVESVRLTDMLDDCGSRILVQQPFIESLQREFSRAMSG